MRRVTKGCLYLCIAVLLFGSIAFVSHKRRIVKRRFSDFHCYYVTGQRLLSRQDIYVIRDPEVAEFRYTPVFAVLMAGLALFDEQTADSIWYILNFLLCVGSFIMLDKLVGGRTLAPRARVFLHLLVIVGTARFIAHTLDSGQANIFMLTSLIAGLYCLRKEREVAAGMLIGLSAMVKYTPMIFLPYFLFRRRYRLALILGAAILLYVLLPAIVVGLKTNLEYLRTMLPLLGDSTILSKITIYDHKNQSLLSMIFRFFTQSKTYFITPQMFFNRFHLSDMAAYTLVAATQLALCAAVFIPAGRATPDRRQTPLIDWVFLSVCVVLVNLNAWVHTFVFLLCAYFLIGAYLFRCKGQDRLALVLLICSYLLNLTTIKGILPAAIAYKAHFYSPHTFSALAACAALLKIKLRPHTMGQGVA